MGNCSPAISGLFLGRKLETHPTGIRGESDEFGGGRMIAKNVGDRKGKANCKLEVIAPGAGAQFFLRDHEEGRKRDLSKRPSGPEGRGGEADGGA